jgi:outer membrane protein, multidrug efflux system
MARPRAILWAVLLGSGGLAGCAHLDPAAASAQTAGSLSHAEIPARWAVEAASGTVAAGWLARFEDPQLDALVIEAVRHNSDLLAAGWRVEQAAQLVKAAGGSLQPSVVLTGKGSTNGGGEGTGINYITALASWEIDVWGRLRAGRAAEKSRHAAAWADYSFARQSLAAAVARSWFMAVEGSLQERAARRMWESSLQLLDLVSVKEKVGRSNDQDVALARADAGTYHDALLRLQAANAQLRRALEVLLNRYPSAEIAVSADLPDPQSPIPAGLPSGILERRPDLIAAENQVAYAFFKKEEARVGMLPQFSLTGSFGAVDSGVFQKIADFSNPIGGLGANFLAPLFKGGALRAQTRVRNAQQREAVQLYASVALRAFLEVENALSSVRTLEERVAVLEKVVRDNETAVRLAQTRYEVGKGDLLAVLQQRLRLFSTQTALLQVRGERLIQRINLHLALGGGFEAPPPGRKDESTNEKGG